MSKDWIGAFVKYVHKLKSSKLPLKTQDGVLCICMYGGKELLSMTFWGSSLFYNDKTSKPHGSLLRTRKPYATTVTIHMYYMFKDVLLVVIFSMNVLFELYITLVRNVMFYTKKKSSNLVIVFFYVMDLKLYIEIYI